MSFCNIDLVLEASLALDLVLTADRMLLPSSPHPGLSAAGPQCEALYLLGVQLLTVEHIDGASRERLLVAHHRGAVQRPAASCHLDDVCKLLRSTGLGESGRRPPHYPDHYFRWEPALRRRPVAVLE